MSEQTAIRIYNFSGIQEDQVCYWFNHAENVWFIYLPGCGAGSLRAHVIEEHPDGTITVTPSIRMRGHDNGAPTEKHGHLTRGVWRDC